MKCSCPKCSALLTENLADIPDKGRSGKCSECNGSYWINKESFILRCYAVDGERYCNNCAEALGHSTYCPGCGTPYPDYCVIYRKKPSPRAFEKKHFSLGLSLPRSTGKSASSSAPKLERKAISGGGSRDLLRQLLMVGGGIALIALIVFGVLLYKQSRAESKFTREFVGALYGVKCGTEQCLEKSAILSGGNRLTDKDFKKLQTVKSEIAAALQVLTPPPKKFRDAHARLLNLSGTYEKFYTLCSSSGSSMEIAAARGTLEEQFYSQAKELKRSLPPELLAELKTKVPRYTNLQFMLE